jgi:HSP20 family molecular chaperone IbpA
MTTLTRQRPTPLADLLNWFESSSGIGLHGPDAPAYIRIEDFMEGANYVLRAELPGINPDKDVSITVEGDILTITAERTEEKKDRDHHEFRYGSFTRSVSLPAGGKTDDIKASYNDGVLEVRVPIDGSLPAPRQIPVQRSGS